MNHLARLAPERLYQRPASTDPIRIGDLDAWRAGIRRTVLANVAGFVAAQCAGELAHLLPADCADVLVQFVNGGKCLRSTFMYPGWLSGAPASDVALSAAASLELSHAFALLQDDVMDNSARPSMETTADSDGHPYPVTTTEYWSGSVSTRSAANRR